jgi:hypothetical protein
LPNFVTRTGVPVRRTSSITARQVALNLEIVISLAIPKSTMVNDHGHHSLDFVTAGISNGNSLRADGLTPGLGSAEMPRSLPRVPD